MGPELRADFSVAWPLTAVVPTGEPFLGAFSPWESTGRMLGRASCEGGGTYTQMWQTTSHSFPWKPRNMNPKTTQNILCLYRSLSSFVIGGEGEWPYLRG